MNPNPGQRQLQEIQRQMQRQMQQQIQDQYRRNMEAAWHMRKQQEERRRAEVMRNRSNVLSNFLTSRPRRPSWPTRFTKGT